MSKEKRNPDYQWFAEPQDAETNRIINEFLSSQDIAPDDVEQVRIADSDGYLHSVMEMTYQNLLYLVKSRKNCPQLKFRTWNRSTPRQSLKDCAHLFQKQKKPHKIFIPNHDHNLIPV